MAYSKLLFFKFKKFVSRSVFGRLQLMQISLNFQTSCRNLKIRSLAAKLCVVFLLFLFWKKLWRFKVKESVLFVEKKYKLMKIKTTQIWKWKISHKVLERWTLRLSSYKNCKLKVKLRGVRARERKKGHFLYRLFCLKEIF